MPVVLVIILWLSSGEVVSRHDIVPPGVLCEAHAQSIQEYFAEAENVRAARAICVRVGRPV